VTDSTLNPMVGIVVTTSPTFKSCQRKAPPDSASRIAPSTYTEASSFRRYPKKHGVSAGISEERGRISPYEAQNQDPNLLLRP
jgi:hypothetical protein